MFALPASMNRALQRFNKAARVGPLSTSNAVTAPALDLALIVGAPRSGTTWLQLLCAAHPHVAGGEESHLFSQYLGNLAHTFYTHKKQLLAAGSPQGLPCYMTTGEFEDALRQFACTVLGKLLRQKPGARLVVEKTPDHALHIGFIRTLFPTAKIVHIIRDSRDAAVSMVAAGKEFWGASWAPKDAAEAARCWVQWVNSARAWSKHPPQLYHELRYEQLKNDGAATLGRVYEFLGAPLPIEQVKGIYDQFSLAACNNNTAPIVMIRCGEKPPPLKPGEKRDASPKGFYRKGKAGGWRESLTAADLEAVEGITRPLMTELGYEMSVPAQTAAPVT
jgi:hypothetical protein